MNGARLLQRAAENLEFTYLSIGAATPGATVTRGPDFSACSCEMGHAVGNFAIVHKLTRDSARELGNLARSKNSFNVYLLPVAPAATVKHLRKEGFEQAWRLNQLWASGQELEGSVECHPVGASERESVAQFMADQFFFRQRAAVRETIAQATANSGLQLCRILRHGDPVGAMMIAQKAGLIGIYNLCIEADLRGMGYGKGAVQCIRATAARAGCDVVLQCDPTLVPWYSSVGFVKEGLIGVYVLERD